MSGIPMNSIANFDLRRRLFLSLVALTGLAGLCGLILALAQAEVGMLARIPLVVLFALTFCWISMAFWHAVIGFVLRWRRLDPVTLRPEACPDEGARLPDPHRTVIAMPVYNEDPDRVGAGLKAMADSLMNSGQSAGFELFVLSDTRDAEVLRQERAVIASLQQQLGQRLPLHYRNRADNRGRKAGNLSDFCRRWGRRYEYMLVLDADSLMDASSMLRLVRAMQDDPRTGLIQTVPIPAGQNSLFARLMQFAAAAYSPMLASGQAFWQGDAANYWGHNAVIRVAAFMDCCGLSELPGRPPLGGEIMSHDFVEAALLRRAGWSVRLETARLASHEEVPANLFDYLRRDRRWMQGNLQHLRLLRLPGLHPASRLHFLFGAAAFLSSLAWLGLLLMGAASMLLYPLPDPVLETAGPNPAALWMLAITLALLFGPRVLGLILALIRRAPEFGGRSRLVSSAVLEALAGILLAPVMMLFHARFAVEIFTGRSVGWSSPPRGDRGLSFRHAVNQGGPALLLGLAWLGLAIWLVPQYLWWMSPVWLGLALAPIMFWLSGSRSLGLAARGAGLLLTPAESQPSEVLLHLAAPAPIKRAGLNPQRPPPPRPGPMPNQALLPVSASALPRQYRRARA